MSKGSAISLAMEKTFHEDAKKFVAEKGIPLSVWIRMIMKEKMKEEGFYAEG